MERWLFLYRTRPFGMFGVGRPMKSFVYGGWIPGAMGTLSTVSTHLPSDQGGAVVPVLASPPWKSPPPGKGEASSGGKGNANSGNKGNKGNKGNEGNKGKATWKGEDL